MTRPITAGVDGSQESLAALDWAAGEAVRTGAPLHVVHAWQPRDTGGEGDRDAQERWVRDAVAEPVRTVTGRHPELTVSTEVREADDPVAVLLAAAADSTTLVLGSRGHGAIVGFLLGSVGRQVIAEATRPVVLVRAGEKTAGGTGGEVVVGQQGEPEDSADVIGYAFEAAAARGATVRAVRAWTLPTVFTYSPGSMALADEAGGLEQYERKALGEALGPWRERFPDVPVVEHVEMGSAGQVLLSVSANARLMVVGRRARRGAVGGRIGSVAHGVLHHADCPVAVVPHT
ncbi:universal stress protein [Streptomyces parvulus]|uniref:Universal stress protein n=1 Tax=Streptomyces parvulus TaxID=146923 RepID=A0A191UT55_9ACTN|nr:MULTISPECIES: universal stress protein [Streptomyces]ANJ05896.1 universal stress protein [Streptomyces parvulus]MCC9157557.1 universal stress protein [Streptomyces parvulus]MCE7689940.1 universal stress protein [Streptomyces parvulus]MCQ4193870.1 universal stress protein [Streptomyces parvulus]MZD59094.1 universal stress protein [Streptomyces sp. SID5606]